MKASFRSIGIAAAALVTIGALAPAQLNKDDLQRRRPPPVSKDDRHRRCSGTDPGICGPRPA